MSKARKALLDSTSASIMIQALSMFSVLVIARLLSPEEIGTYAVVSALVMLLSQFKDSGAGAYLIRESAIDCQKVRSALGVTFVLSWVITVFLVSSSFLVVKFYEIADAPLVIGILSITFLISPYISIPHALLVRKMRFDTIRNVEVMSAVIGLMVTIILVICGLSYFAIAIGYVADSVCRLFFINIAVRQTEMQYTPSLKNIGEIIKLGIATTSSNILKQGTHSAPDLIIGKLGSVFDVGIFSRGFGFVKFVGQSLSMGISSMSLTYVADINRNGADLAKAYVRASYLFNGFAMPVYWVAAVVSLPTIRFLFGEQWDASASIASALLIWGSIKSLNFQFHHFMIVMDQKRAMLLRDLYNLVAILICCIVFYKFGLLAIAYGFIAIAVIENFVLLLTLRKYVGVSVKFFLVATFKNATIATLCALFAVFLSHYFDFENIRPAYAMLTLFMSMPLFLLAIIFVMRHPLFDEIKKALAYLYHK